MKTGCFFRKCKEYLSVVILCLSAYLLKRTSAVIVDALLFSRGIDPDSLGGDLLRALSGELILCILSLLLIRKKSPSLHGLSFSVPLMLSMQTAVSLSSSMLLFRARVNVPFSGEHYIAYIIIFAVSQPLAEELFFRSALKLTGTSNSGLIVSALCSALVCPQRLAETLALSLISGNSLQSTLKAALSRSISRLCGILIIYCGVRSFEGICEVSVVLSITLIICGIVPEFCKFVKEDQNGKR